MTINQLIDPAIPSVIKYGWPPEAVPCWPPKAVTSLHNRHDRLNGNLMATEERVRVLTGLGRKCQ